MFCLLVALALIVAAESCSNGAFFDKPAIYQVTEPYDMTEAPTWDPRRNMLFFVDIHTGRVLSYDYYKGTVNEITLSGKVTPVVISTNPKIVVVGLNRSVVAVEWDGVNKIGKQKILSTVADQFPDSRFNDGKVDSKGRLWFGTSGEEFYTRRIHSLHGLLYKITKDNLENPTVEIAPVNISNGLAWNAANDKFYYIDSSICKVNRPYTLCKMEVKIKFLNIYNEATVCLSSSIDGCLLSTIQYTMSRGVQLKGTVIVGNQLYKTCQIAEYSYNAENGTISNRRILFDLNDYNLPGIPDGMTIDEDDNLWIALYRGGSIIKVSKKGKLLQVIGLPARDVTSAMWGGPNLDVLFVTSARLNLTEEERRLYPAAGSVFAITNLKTKGRPMFNTNIIDSI